MVQERRRVEGLQEDRRLAAHWGNRALKRFEAAA
jgi:hypothetical protein